MQNASTKINIPVLQFDCNGTANSQWRLHKVRHYTFDWYELQNVNSGLCLAVQNADTANGTPLLQYTCNGTVNAQFTWVAPFG